MGLLDPRFKYVPASSTDITATWQRHGFDARRNAERRARLLQPAAEATATTSTAEIHPLIRRMA